MADAPATSSVVEAGLRLIGALHNFDITEQRLRCQLRAFEPTTVLEDLLVAAGDDTSRRLTVLNSEEANRRIAAHVEGISAESAAASARLSEAIGAFRALEDQMEDAPRFLTAIGRWVDAIESDRDAVHGAARRRSCRRHAERCLGADSPIHKRPRYSRLPIPEPDGAESDVALAQIRYTDGNVAAYAERYDSQRTVARGERLAYPYIYADDGITVLCPSCHSRRIVHIHESLVINTGAEHGPLIAALGDGLTPEEFLSAPASTWHCANCGRWVVQQEIVGEDCRYCLQVVGALGRYENPDEELSSTLVDRLAWANLRLRDLDPAEFEKLAADFLRKTLGPCDVHLVGRGSGRQDGGVDLVLVRADDEYLVQVKHHPQRLDGKVTESVLPIRSLHGVMFREQIARGVFVTAADGYSRSALSETQQASGMVPGYELQLYDRMDLSAWVLDVATEEGPPWLPFMRSGVWTQAIASTWATPEVLARAYRNARVRMHTDLR